MADPRALQDSISKQRGLIPPSEDQFFGQQLKPQQSVVENILRYLYNPEDPGIGPADLPINAGVVISEKTLPLLLKKIEKAGGLSGSTQDAATYANNYIKAKYPKIRALVDKLTQTDTYPTGLKGNYFPDTNSIVLNKNNSPFTQIDTLTHELTHALQKKRGYDFKDYIPPSVDFNNYFNQDVEINARRAGKTALDGYAKFVDLFLAQKK